MQENRIYVMIEIYEHCKSIFHDKFFYTAYMVGEGLSMKLTLYWKLKPG